jgi:hypothetical protein
MGSPLSLTSSLFTFHALRSVAGRSSNALAPDSSVHRCTMDEIHDVVVCLAAGPVIDASSSRFHQTRKGHARAPTKPEWLARSQSVALNRLLTPPAKPSSTPLPFRRRTETR